MSGARPDAPRNDGAQRFVRANTAIDRAPLVPELRLHLATEVTPLWEATESDLQRTGLPPPYWAFAWAGGQALARYLIDHPNIVAGKRVMDFAAGGGLVALAAALAGADEVTAAEIDPYAVAAIALNAEANDLPVAPLLGDIVGDPLDGVDVVTAGDVCYERAMAEQAIAWLRPIAGTGRTVLLADPGRAYLPKTGLTALASYDVPVSLDLEDREIRPTTVYRLEP